MLKGPSIAPPTRAIRLSVLAIACIICGTTAYLATRYASLPDLLPVHFRPNGFPNGWQFKTPARVLLPVLVQVALTFTLGAVGALLLSRPGVGEGSRNVAQAPDIRAAAVAAEAVILITLIWVAFQAYAAWALVRMWTAERAGLGSWYDLPGVHGSDCHARCLRPRSSASRTPGAETFRRGTLALWPALQECQ